VCCSVNLMDERGTRSGAFRVSDASSLRKSSGITKEMAGSTIVMFGDGGTRCEISQGPMVWGVALGSLLGRWRNAGVAGSLVAKARV
jgi:hypothetical protein